MIARVAKAQRKTGRLSWRNLKTGEGVDEVIAFLREKGGLAAVRRGADACIPAKAGDP